MTEINVAEWFSSKSLSFLRCKEGDLPLLNFSNLTCMGNIVWNVAGPIQHSLLYAHRVKTFGLSYFSTIDIVYEEIYKGITKYFIPSPLRGQYEFLKSYIQPFDELYLPSLSSRTLLLEQIQWWILHHISESVELKVTLNNTDMTIVQGHNTSLGHWQQWCEVSYKSKVAKDLQPSMIWTDKRWIPDKVIAIYLQKYWKLLCCFLPRIK